MERTIQLYTILWPIKSTLLPWVSQPMVLKLQTHSRKVCPEPEPSTWSCGNALHGAQKDNANSITSSLVKRESFQPLPLNQTVVMSVTNMLIAIYVSMLRKEILNAVGALVVLLTTRVSDKPHSNVVVSKLDNHTLLPAQLISELSTARVIHAILEPRNAASVKMDHSQISHHALIFAAELSHMLNATHKLKNVKTHANKVNQAASTEISATFTAKHQNQNATQPLVNA